MHHYRQHAEIDSLDTPWTWRDAWITLAVLLGALLSAAVITGFRKEPEPQGDAWTRDVESQQLDRERDAYIQGLRDGTCQIRGDSL